MKKKNVMIITAAVLVCAITITGIARAVRGGGSAVDVTQVSYLNSGWWDEGTSTSGYVTANASQDVYLESDSVVEKVYVKKGDKVKIGDTLLEYDKTLLQLNLEEEQINKQIQELELQGAKNDLEKLKKITPVPDSEGSSSGASLLDEPDDSSDDLDDSGADGYEEARAMIVKHNVSLVSTAAGADVQVIDGNSDGSDSTGTAQESGTPITAEITEISKYPSNADGNYYGGDSNPNASSYPFTAYIEDSDDLINHEYVDIQIEGNGGNGSSVYLPKALIRMENGQSYVYIEGKNKKLKKQYVRTGQTLYSTYIEVKEGVSETDWIAFPYGKAVKEGAPVKELEGSGFADQLY